MQVELRGRVALVTGAGSGIGQAIARALAASGAEIIVNYRQNRAGAEETLRLVRKARSRGWLCRADVSEPDAVRQMFATPPGRVDILVNNAGDPVARRSLDACTAKFWDQVMAVNLRSVFLCSQAALAGMRQRGWGRIVNISSIGAAAGGSPGTLPYAAAKGAVETFTRGLARVVGGRGITVNAVAPGSIGTGMQRRLLSPAYLRRRIAETAVGRGGTPEEVAAAVLFLCSAEAAYITGQVVRVDGGRRA